MKKYLLIFLIGCNSSRDLTICKLDPAKNLGECATGDKTFLVKIKDMVCGKDAQGKDVNCWYAVPEETVQKIADKLQQCEQKPTDFKSEL